MLVAADTIFWEAVLADGRTVRESEGGRYTELPPHAVRGFSLRAASGEPILETRDPGGSSQMRFRRRSDGGGGEPKRTLFLVGWVPRGPVVLIDPAALDTDRAGRWVAGLFHEDADCGRAGCTGGHPPGAFSPPDPLPGELVR